jgi:hypothetical protein
MFLQASDGTLTLSFAPDIWSDPCRDLSVHRLTSSTPQPWFKANVKQQVHPVNHKSKGHSINGITESTLKVSPSQKLHHFSERNINTNYTWNYHIATLMFSPPGICNGDISAWKCGKNITHYCIPSLRYITTTFSKCSATNHKTCIQIKLHVPQQRIQPWINPPLLRQHHQSKDRHHHFETITKISNIFTSKQLTTTTI